MSNEDEVPEQIQVRALAALFFATRLFRGVGLMGLSREDAAKHSAADAQALIKACKEMGS